jgi:sec-independent protein translocase protein TatC
MSAQPIKGRFRMREPDPKYMTFVEHLEELRHRLIVAVSTIAAGSVVGWFLAKRTITLLDAPLNSAYESSHHGKHLPLYIDTIYGGFTLNLKIAIAIGVMIALPVLVYQVWAFCAPAFGPNANRWGPIVISTSILLFLAGVVTGYEVIPLAIRFFLGFDTQNLQILPFASQYVGFVALILVVFGISFELPVVLVSLTALGLTSSGWLWSKRAHFFFGIFAFSTVITPGADPVSPIILGVILFVLYLGSVVVSKAIGK